LLGGSDDFMMLPVDMALGWDPVYAKHVAFYDAHRAEFRRDAARAWKKLTELGCDGLLTPEKNAPW
jgi:cytochrome c peroxidase